VICRKDEGGGGSRNLGEREKVKGLEEGKGER